MADPKKTNIVDERWRKGVMPLRRDHRNYWVNTSYVVGEQWITWSNSESAIRRLEADPRRARVTRNRIKRSLIINLAKILKNPLEFDVSPDSADDAAIKGAELGKTALTDVRDRRGWEQIRHDETMSTMVGGTAAVSIEWDAAGYKAMGNTENGKSYGIGEVCLDALSIVEFACQPGVSDGEYGCWWVKQTAEDPAETQERYNLATMPEPDATTALGSFESRIVGASATMSGATRAYDGRVMVRTMFERPTKKNPAGRVVTSISGEIVQDVPWPFPWKDRLNLVVFRDFKMDGRWTGESRITDAIPIQTEINVARSIITDHLKKIGAAKLYIPDTSIDEEDLNDDPGQPVFYNPVGGAKPEWTSPPTLPQWEVQYPEQAASEVDDIMGVHDVSRGEAPPGIEAGVALQVLAERDDTPLGLIAKDQSEGWGRLGTMTLRLYEKYLKVGRDMAVRPNGIAGATSPRPFSVNFTGTELHGQTKATVPLEVMQPKSRAAQMAYASSLMQMGAFGTPPDMRLFVRVADLPDKSDMLAALNADADRAQRENEMMFRDQAAVVKDYDNHAVHITEHNWARKSERYDRATPREKELFDVHVKAHATMAAEAAGRQEMKATESPALAQAAQADQPPGSDMPPAAAEALAQQGGPPPPAMPSQVPPEALIPPPAPAPASQGAPQ